MGRKTVMILWTKETNEGVERERRQCERIKMMVKVGILVTLKQPAYIPMAPFLKMYGAAGDQRGWWHT
jgi:hypothetical protein